MEPQSVIESVKKKFVHAVEHYHEQLKSLRTGRASSAMLEGVFVEVYGEGILLLGESGVGKSETAIELVKRGHRLIADDAASGR